MVQRLQAQGRSSGICPQKYISGVAGKKKRAAHIQKHRHLSLSVVTQAKSATVSLIEDICDRIPGVTRVPLLSVPPRDTGSPVKMSFSTYCTHSDQQKPRDLSQPASFISASLTQPDTGCRACLHQNTLRGTLKRDSSFCQCQLEMVSRLRRVSEVFGYASLGAGRQGGSVSVSESAADVCLCCSQSN